MANVYNYDQLLPDFEDLIQQKATIDDRAKNRFNNKNNQIILPTTSSASSSNSSTSASSSTSFTLSNSYNTNISLNSHKNLQDCQRSESSQSKDKNLCELPPIINNSLVVRQKASAKDSLAAATVTTGASLPLMIGGRSKCVVNILPEIEKDSTQEQQLQEKLQSNSNFIGPKNTALRAEQRKQNMVSIVRPVVNLQAHNKQQHFEQTLKVGRKKFEDTSIWEETSNKINNKTSIIDELMQLEQSNNMKSFVGSPTLNYHQFGNDCQVNIEDYNHLMLSGNKNKFSCLKLCDNGELDCLQSRQQMILFRREEYELNKSILKQHRFVKQKIDERKRNLLIIQSIWYQKDFKHAIEKLVDIYQQGLVFSNNHCDIVPRSNSNKIESIQTKLSSVNSSLVVDVLSVIILRPQLWNLEVCQLLLPIIVNDLLDNDTTTRNSLQNDSYTEVSLKALKLILNNFSPVIKTTLENLKNSSNSVGIDLSREERISKCFNCYKFLMDANRIIAKKCANSSNTSKYAPIYRELHQAFIILENSLDKTLKANNHQ